MMKQNEEIQAVYDKYGTGPTGGCAQLLIQFPIFLAFFNVVRNVPAYIPQVKEHLYECRNCDPAAERLCGYH